MDFKHIEKEKEDLYNKFNKKRFNVEYLESVKKLHKKVMMEMARSIGIDTENEKMIEIIWEKAYEYGHSEGYHEIYEYFQDFADMVIKCVNALKN